MSKLNYYLNNANNRKEKLRPHREYEDMKTENGQ